MSSLKGKTISRTYQKLIQSDGQITDSSLKQISTGDGIPVSLKLSTTKAEVSKLGIGTDGIAPDGLLHVLEVGAGAVTANNSGNQLVLENSANCGLSILSGSSNYGNIFFGSESGGNDSGSISYDHSSSSMIFSSGDSSATLNYRGDLSISGELTEAEDRYVLRENFTQLPVRNIQNALVSQTISETNTVTSNTRSTRIETVSAGFNDGESHEFTFNNDTIEVGSHVLAYILDWSEGSLPSDSIATVMAYEVANGSCKIRIRMSGAALTYTGGDGYKFTIQVVVDPHKTFNNDWALSGTNVTDSMALYGGPGLKLSTGAVQNDSTLVHPKDEFDGIYPSGHYPDSDESAWSQNGLRPDQQLAITMPISTQGSVSDMGFWAGIKTSSAGSYTIDDDQAYFLYASDNTLNNITNNSNLHFVYSIDGTDYVTDLGIAVSAATKYNLKIDFDEESRAAVFVNGVQYGLTDTPTTTTAGGVIEVNSTKRSLAVNSIATLTETSRPYVGVQTFTTAAKELSVHFIKASRSI